MHITYSLVSHTVYMIGSLLSSAMYNDITMVLNFYTPMKPCILNNYWNKEEVTLKSEGTKWI